MSAIFPNDAAFPHDAVVQRYLHTGKRRSKRKIVIASMVGMLACGVVAAAVPGGSPKSGAEKSVKAEQAKPVPAVQVTSVPAVQPAAQEMANRLEAAPTPPKAEVETSSNPPAPLAPAPVSAAAVPAPQPDAPAVAVPPPAASDHVADVSAPKQVDTKFARKAGHRLTAAERRNRLAHARALRGAAQPTLVRVYDLPDGRRIYQRVTGDEARLNYPGGELRRVYLAPVNRGVD